MTTLADRIEPIEPMGPYADIAGLEEPATQRDRSGRAAAFSAADRSPWRCCRTPVRGAGPTARLRWVYGSGTGVVRAQRCVPVFAVRVDQGPGGGLSVAADAGGRGAFRDGRT